MIRLAVQQWSAVPRLFVVDDFLSRAEIAHVLRLAEHPETLQSGLRAEHSVAGDAFEMPVGDDPVLRAVRERLEGLIGFGNDLDATFRFRRYGPGEFHPEHLDAFSARGTELILTALIDLVAPDEGGDTLFPLAADGPCAVPHRAGRLVVWYNHTPDGAVDPHSSHAGLPVIAGEKTTITAFVYKPAYYAASPFPAEPAAPRAERLTVLHAGGDREARRAWENAARWVGFAVDTVDARRLEASRVDAHRERRTMLPVDLSAPVRRVLAEQYEPGWISVFREAPRVCVEPSLFLARRGFPMHADTSSESAPRQWLAVAGDRIIGPAAPDAMLAMAPALVSALQAFTGLVEYVTTESGEVSVVRVDAPTTLAALPIDWWSPFCLEVLEHYRTRCEAARGR